MQIRAAKNSDLAAMMALEQASFHCDQISLRQMRYLLTKAKAFCLVVENNNAVVAYALCLTPAKARPARLYSLAVAHCYQGQGLAYRLVTAVMRKAGEQGCKRLRLEVSCHNHRAKALYDSLGFVALGVLAGYYSDGSDGIKMECELAR